jgi:protein-S-isoprenylcysteine O-methyltransferase Ste14
VPLYVIFVLHGLFIGTFVLRWAASRRAATRRQSPASGTAERPARMGAAPHANTDVVVHLAAWGLLYVTSGLTLAQIRPDPWLVRTPMFPRQPVIGAVVMLLGDGLLIWTMLVFGSWRLLARIEPTHELATTGPFGLVRHPNYLAMMLVALGTFLWIPTPWVLGALVAIVAVSERRARAEERLLVETFGERYRAYLRRVQRWIPGLY